MKVKPSKEIENKNEKKIFIDFFKDYLDIKEKNIKNIKIYFGSNEIFDTEKYYNKNDTSVK